MNAEDATMARVVHGEREPIAAAIELIVAAFRAGGRLVYVGAGTSGRLGVLDATECPPTFGVPPTMVVGVIAGGRPALGNGATGGGGAGQPAGAGRGNRGRTKRGASAGVCARGAPPCARRQLSPPRQLA